MRIGQKLHTRDVRHFDFIDGFGREPQFIDSHLLHVAKYRYGFTVIMVGPVIEYHKISKL